MQFFIARRCVTEDKMDSLFIAYNKQYRDKANKTIDKQTLISRSNKQWRLFGFQIKRVFDAANKTFYYVLTNEIDDSLSTQNSLSQKESAFYFVIVDEIVQSFLSNEESQIDPDNIDFRFMSINFTAAINLARKVPISMVLGEKLIKHWLTVNWFTKTDSGRITLGMRTLSIMSSYLQKKFAIYTCYSCHLACLIGVVCPKCNVCLHYHYCSDANSRNGKIFCPTCRPDQKMSGLKSIMPPSQQESEGDENQNETHEETMDSD